MTELKIRVRDWAACLVMLAVMATFMTHARPAFAQSTGAAVLTGTVVDAAEKKPVADVVVTATSPALQGEQVVVTDSAGFYRIPDLPSGSYTLKLEKDGFKPYERGGIELRSDVTIRVNAEILPTTLQSEVIQVVAKAPTVDVGSSSVGQNINSDFTRRVPLAQPGNKGSASRSFEAVAEVTPGAKTDTYGVSIAGASSPENGYIVDGLSVGNPSNGTIGTGLSSEFVKEVNVISGGYMPEYGRTMGGVLNAVTKSGSNEFHGSVFGYYSPGSFSGTPKVAREVVDTVVSQSPLAYIGDIGFDIGGPIQKDKLWFYGGVDFSSQATDVNRSFYRQIYDPTAPDGIKRSGGVPVTEQIQGMDQHYQAVEQALQAIVKLTYALNADNKLTATFIAAPTWTGGNNKFAYDPRTGGPETDATGFSGTYGSLATQRNNAAYDGSIKWSTEFDKKKILVDSMVGWHHQDDSVLPSDGSLPGSKTGLASVPNVQWARAPNYHGLPEFESGFSQLCAAPAGAPASLKSQTLCPVTTYSSGGPAGQLTQQSLDRYIIGSTVTYLFQGLGHHVAKAGVSIEYTSWDHLKAHSGGTQIAEGATGTLKDPEHFGVLIGPDNPAFLEPFHVTTKSVIAGGFVQDSWSVIDKFTLNLGLRYDTQQMYGGNGQLGLSMPMEWSPRIGAIYDPTQEGRSKFFANYARYYENVPLGLADGSLTGEPSTFAQYNGKCDVAATQKAPYCQDNSYRAIQNSANSPSQKWTQFGAGATPIDPKIEPTSADEIVLGGEYELFKDSRVGASYTKRWLNHWIEDMSRDNRQTFFLGNPGYGIASDFVKAQRDYDALTLYFMKAFGDDWLTSASYTISYLRGNIGGLFAANGELDVNHNYDFDSKSLTINTQGPLPGDHTHDIKIFSAKDWELTKEHAITTGGAFRAKSGEPLNFWASDYIYQSSINLLLPRGSGGRLPWQFDIDMNLGYRYSIDKDKTISFTVDIFNLFNFQEVTQRDEIFTQAYAYGKQGGTLRDVTVQNPDGTLRQPAKGNPYDQRLYASDKNVNFLSPTGYQEPRKFRFGIRGTF